MYELDIALLVLSFACAAFFSASESALTSLGVLRLKRLSKEKKFGSEELVRLKANPARMITTVLIGSNISNISVSFLVAHLTTVFAGEAYLGVAAGALVLLMLVFGEIIPKTYAINHSEKISLIAAPIIGVLEIIFAPIIFMLEISGIIFPQIINTKYTRHRFSEEEIRAMLEFGVEDKAISSDERKLLERVLDFNDTLVKEVMVSRDLTKCLEETDTREEVVQKVSKFKKNMYPVLSIDGEVVGVLSIKKLVSASGMKNPKDIMDRPLFASKESIAYDLFKKMQKSNTHMAIVVDSNGQFEGVVTMEDLLEEIVGEIEDSAIPPSFIQLDKSILLVSGTARLHDIEKELNVNILDAERFGSVAGFMHFCLKRIPLKGDTLLLKDVKFEVKEMHGNAIERVQVTRLK